MQVCRQIPISAQGPCVLTIGNFDGVHLGHRALLARLRAKADALGLPAVALCFEPHPREYFSLEAAPPRLCSLRRKLQLLSQTGIDRVIVQRFNAAFAQQSADAFISQTLARDLQTRHLMIGDDFRFGRGRDGDFAALLAGGKLHGFTVEAMPTLEVAGERASSSAVREALQAGQIEHAARLLGEPFVVEGRVLPGAQIGRTIGFPTANIQLRQPSLPLAGVFAVTVDGGPFQRAIGAASVGVRPTIGDRLALKLEVFVLDYSGDLYGQRLRVRFWHKVRDEQKYPSLDALKHAIQTDCNEVRNYFAAHPEFVSL
ncbi:bifunctional riboflavin kinase/FAD synthetase [Uliginosibacterium gangwonense]|uniref:bifunctional riboflavin kinase/FAD synthetase n=1 Tax=Uliginosibacterium gangwonense TaxID=392736 RepID=UPI00035F6C95|nr:bifunctional riboflavin kinase/FAD synthetase [Uliginosibacterium gangwonense]